MVLKMLKMMLASMTQHWSHFLIAFNRCLLLFFQDKGLEWRKKKGIKCCVTNEEQIEKDREYVNERMRVNKRMDKGIDEWMEE